MKKFFKNFFGNPVLPTLTAVLTIIAVAFISAPDRKVSEMSSKRLAVLQSDNVRSANKIDSDVTATGNSSIELTPVIADIPETNPQGSTDNYSTEPPEEALLYGTTDITDISETTTELSSATGSETTTTAVTTTGEPHVYDYSYTSAGESPNSDYYQERLTIIGDSIAYGFNAYGYIPYEHNIAKESLAVWNMDSYYFDMGGGSMGVIDSADYVNSPLYFISMGMNDIYSCTPEEYGASMLNVAQQVLERVPTATIVVGAITPVSEGNYYTTNDNIRSFNYALQNSINGAGSSQILFFDTYSLLADPYTLALGYDHSSGDGMHLSSYSYSYVLNCLFNFLDEADIIEQIQLHDTTGY